MAEFLDEVNGDFVLHTKSDAGILAIVDSRIYPEAAPKDTEDAHVIYTQADGRRIKSHSGISSAEQLVLHIYAISVTQPQANALARLIESHWLATEGTIGNGTRVQVCNGGIYDRGQWLARTQSTDSRFYVRLVLRMLLGS